MTLNGSCGRNDRLPCGPFSSPFHYFFKDFSWKETFSREISRWPSPFCQKEVQIYQYIGTYRCFLRMVLAIDLAKRSLVFLAFGWLWFWLCWASLSLWPDRSTSYCFDTPHLGATYSNPFLLFSWDCLCSWLLSWNSYSCLRFLLSC